MRSAVVVAIVIAASACSASTVRRANQVGAGLMIASMACDGGGTMRAASTGWQGTQEVGPARAVMGPDPSASNVYAYFAFTTIALLGVAQLVPERARPYFYGAVTVAEVYTAVGNAPRTGPCGL